MQIYSWARGSRVKIDAQSAGGELQRIRDKHSKLTPAVVVDEARDEQSPLHLGFEWDDTIAADEYRLMQARYLLRSIVVKIDDQRNPVRAFVVVQDRSETNQTYEAIVQVLNDADMKKQVLQRAWKELEDWKRRYEEYEELAELFSAIELHRTDAA